MSTDFSTPTLTDNLDGLPVLLNQEQVAEWLSCTTRNVENLRKNQGLPSIKIGHLVRFELDSVRAWLAKKQVIFTPSATSQPEKGG